MMPKTDKPDGKSQYQRFVEAARELGCDESKEAFEAKLGKIARRQPKPLPTPPTEGKIDDERNRKP